MASRLARVSGRSSTTSTRSAAAAASRPGLAPGSTCSGTRTVKQDPAPVVLSTVTVPFISVTSRWLMARPRPVPP